MGVEIQGFCDGRFAPLRKAFAANFEDGLEVGAALAVTLKGESLVDLWAGHADFARTRPWTPDTTACVFSTSKVPLILSFLMLVDRGQVDLDATVASYWPEFAAGGKGHVTVREAMSHRAGVPGFEPAVAYDLLYDWEATCARLAAETHWFGGESLICYHPVTYGFLLGEIMRRVDGRLPSQFFHDEFAARAGLDFSFGLHTDAAARRTAEVNFLRPPGVFMTRNDLARKVTESIAARGQWGPADWNGPAFRTAEIPAANGHGSARSLARLGAIAANGGSLDGVALLSPSILKEATREQAHGVDAYMGEASLGLGFGLPSPGFPMPTPSLFHWGGYGGSFLIMDYASGFAIAYAPNNLMMPDDEMATDARVVRWVEALFEVLPAL